MATQPAAPFEPCSDLPGTIDEQADILRAAVRSAGVRRRLDDAVWLEGWESDFLLGEARKPGAVAHEARVLLRTRAAEWATRRALRRESLDRDAYDALLADAERSWSNVQRAIVCDPPASAAVIGVRLRDLRQRLGASSSPELGEVIPWPGSREASSTGALDSSTRAFDPGAIALDSATRAFDPGPIALDSATRAFDPGAIALDSATRAFDPVAIALDSATRAFDPGAIALDSATRAFDPGAIALDSATRAFDPGAIALDSATRAFEPGAIALDSATRAFERDAVDLPCAVAAGATVAFELPFPELPELPEVDFPTDASGLATPDWDREASLHDAGATCTLDRESVLAAVSTAPAETVESVGSEPARDTAAEPADSLGFAEPTDPFAFAEPADSLAFAEPTDSLAFAEPADSLAFAEPTDSLAFAEPADPLALVESTDPLALTEPADPLGLAGSTDASAFGESAKQLALADSADELAFALSDLEDDPEARLGPAAARIEPREPDPPSPPVSPRQAVATPPLAAVEAVASAPVPACVTAAVPDLELVLEVIDERVAERTPDVLKAPAAPARRGWVAVALAAAAAVAAAVGVALVR